MFYSIKTDEKTTYRILVEDLQTMLIQKWPNTAHYSFHKISTMP